MTNQPQHPDRHFAEAEIGGKASKHQDISYFSFSYPLCLLSVVDHTRTTFSIHWNLWISATESVPDPEKAFLFSLFYTKIRTLWAVGMSVLLWADRWPAPPSASGIPDG